MELQVIDSGSRGNCFVIHSGTSALILECGVSFKRLAHNLEYRVDKIDGCLLTHEHGDHAGYWKQYTQRGIKIYTSPGTKNKLSDDPKIVEVNAKKIYRIGEFKVMPFDVKHDVENPYGYLIYHPEIGNTLFAIDTCYIPYKFKNLSAVIVEANYDLEILDQHVRNGDIEPFVRNRILRNHMEVHTVVNMFKANDLTDLHTVVLTHLSSVNGDGESFKNKISGITGIPTYIAEKGAKFNLTKVF